ncbi:MAG: M1 family metallopeptidase [Planctomycetota bacterium]
MSRIRPFLVLPCLAGFVCSQATTDALHYKLELELVFTNQTIVGQATETFASLVPNLGAIDLDLTSALTVSAVRMGGVPVAFTRPTDTIHVVLDQLYQPQQQFTVEIDYAGTPPPSTSLGGMVFTTHSGAPMAWTLSEPWDAKLWWPGKDVLGDKATFEMWLIHPNTMTGVSNGALQGVDVLSGNRLRSRWQTNYPMAAYLASLAVTNYQRRTDTYTGQGANMPVEFYVFPENWSSWQTGLDRVVPMLDAFSGAYGQYPWTAEKYGIAQFTWGGGMEHQTVASQSSVSEYLTAHELSHQWWGDLVTCATWHDIWLNEGFATFSEALWAERKLGGTLAAYLSRMQTNKPTNTSGTVWVTDISNVNAVFSTNNVYRKGGWALHMLRGVLGDATFFQCLADYRAAFGGSSATTADFRGVCEQTAGRDLGWFFDEWIMNPGSPAYTYGWRARTWNGRQYVLLELDQTQTLQAAFTMPIKVRVTTAAGTETQVVWNDRRQDQRVIALTSTSPATAIAIDPDQWILRSTPVARTFTAPFFGTTTAEVDTVAGGDVEFHGERDATAANRPYLVVLGLSGSSPGTNVLGLQVPVNADWFTNLAIGAIYSPTLTGFLGNLDAQGRMAATFHMAPGYAVPLRGVTITAAYFDFAPFDFASRAVEVALR